MLIDRDALFAGVKKPLFHGQFAQTHVDGINAIADAYEAAGYTFLDWLAYILATAYFETAYTMRPLEEYGRGAGKPYGQPGRHGQAQYGRGFVQLTWDANYEKADAALGLDGQLLRDFALALRPDIAAQILVRGMAEGWFTSHKLGDYLNATTKDFVNARRIVNGTDKAELIAGYAQTFRASLRAAIAPPAPIPSPPDIPAPEPEPVAVEPALGWWGRFWRAIFGPTRAT